MRKPLKLIWSLLFLVACRYLPSEPLPPAASLPKAAKAVGPAADSVEKVATLVKVEGATLQYFPREIPQSQRTPRGEIEAIDGATATLKVEKPISFRRVTLPAGEYELSITTDDGKIRYLVVEPKKPVEGQGKEASSSQGSSPSGKRKVDSASALDKAAGKQAQGKEGEEENGNSGKQAGSPPVKLKAPLALSPAQMPGDALSFDLKVSGKGSRLRVILHAGSTDARTSPLRLADK